jgi:broad specificity phosphatase PhoE
MCNCLHRHWKPAVATALACVSLNAAAQRTVILVRHAELEGQKMAQSAETPLSPEGRTRAARLAEMLQPAGLTAVYASDFVRTRATAEPAAQQQGLTVTVVPKSESASLVPRIREAHPDGTVLVVAHSDTLPTLLAAFGRTAEEGRVGSTDHGQLFILTPVASGPASLVRLRY